MRTSLKTSSDEVRNSILQFLWRQWSAVGVAGSIRTADRWVIDPEALLLFTTTHARHDSRLFDEVVDWLLKNGECISLVRLSRMSKESGFGELSILAAIAEHLQQRSAHVNWKSILGRGERHEPGELLFPGVPVFGEPDEIFGKWGWQREQVETRGMSQAPPADRPATFLLQLRGLFGRQARAEIFAWLLCHESGHPSRIARETCY